MRGRCDKAGAHRVVCGAAGNGVETAWLPAGIGLRHDGSEYAAARFRCAAEGGVAGARFDCDYSGSFESGAVSGPARNGAPCRRMSDNDPLKGVQLRIIDRSAT